jgi:hypothetical protein
MMMENIDVGCQFEKQATGPRLLKDSPYTLYLYTFSLYENASLIIFSAEAEYISTRYW